MFITEYESYGIAYYLLRLNYLPTEAIVLLGHIIMFTFTKKLIKQVTEKTKRNVLLLNYSNSLAQKTFEFR